MAEAKTLSHRLQHLVVMPQIAAVCQSLWAAAEKTETCPEPSWTGSVPRWPCAEGPLPSCPCSLLSELHHCSRSPPLHLLGLYFMALLHWTFLTRPGSLGTSPDLVYPSPRWPPVPFVSSAFPPPPPLFSTLHFLPLLTSVPADDLLRPYHSSQPL